MTSNRVGYKPDVEDFTPLWGVGESSVESVQGADLDREASSSSEASRLLEPVVPVPPATSGGGVAKQVRDGFSQLMNETGTRDDPYERGFSDGQKSALDEMNDQLKRKIDQWDQQFESIAAAIEKHLHEYLDGVNERVVQIAIAVAEKIIRCEMQLDPTKLSGAVASILTSFRNDVSVRVDVHPEDKVLLDDWIATADDASASRLTIESAQGFDRGDFRIEVGPKTYDLTVSGQLQRIEAELINAYEDQHR